MMDDEIPTIDDEARAMSLAYYRIQRAEIHRLRESLQQARELIEELIESPEFKNDSLDYYVQYIGFGLYDAARKWLEENGDA